MMTVKNYLDKSEIHGIGIFAGEFIPKGTIVWEFTPNFDLIISDDQILLLKCVQQDYILDHGYRDNFFNKIVLCGDNTRYMNFARDFNTSYSRNSRSQKMESYAIRDIQKGEEITYPIHEDEDAYLKLSDEIVTTLINNYEEAKEKIIVKHHNNRFSAFAARNFRAGDFLTTMAGDIFSSQTIIGNYGYSKYLQIGEDQYLGPSGQVDDFINHSCSPNAFLKIDKYTNNVAVFALNNIESGEEITLDYSITWKNSYEAVNCSCGRKNCRKKVGDFSSLNEKIRKYYMDKEIVPEYAQTGLDGPS